MCKAHSVVYDCFAWLVHLPICNPKRSVGCISAARPGRKMPLKFSTIAIAAFTASDIGFDIVSFSSTVASIPVRKTL